MKMTADEFNAKHPVGTPVRYWPVLPPNPAFPPIETVTRTEAWNLGHGDPVVSIEGKSGGVDLSHVELSDHLLAGTIWTLNKNGYKVAADPDSRDYACNKEATRDVVFLLQIRTVGHFDPNHLTYENATSADDGEVWVDVDMFDTEEVAKAKAEDRFEEENEDHRFNAIRVDDDFLLEKEWVTSHWRTESVWLRRDEAEAFAKSKAYKFGELGKGCRVYGDCAEGRLASILRLIENKHVEEYLLSNSFRMDYRAHRRAMEKMIGGQVA